MTILLSTNVPRVAYTVGQGVVQKVFAVPFEFFDDEDVTIYVDGIKKTLGSHYTLSGGNGAVGTLTFNTTGGTQLITGATGGSTVIIVRDVEISRVTDFATSGDINRTALNLQLDTLVAQIADMDDRLSRTIQLNDFEVAPSMLLTADRKDKILAFNASTGNVEAGPSISAVNTAVTALSTTTAKANEAAASATSAASSATTATAKATIATDKSALAATAKTNAETAETNAETAETNAASSASTATTRANTATAQADIATAKATIATDKAAIATTKASEAASSASSMSSSVTAATAAKDAALAALDSFDDRYLGTKSSDPSVDNDGNSLVAGALYFNTSDNTMKVYEGSAWVAAYASLSGTLLKSGGTMTGNISHGGNFTLDVAGDIILDADGAEVFFADGGTNYGKTMKSGNDFRLKSEISDGDFVVQGVDNGSIITALTLDMSDAGTAIFNNKVGIGTTSPTRQMSVENTLANGGGSIGITSSDSSTSGSLGIVHFGNSTDSSLASIGGLADGSTSAGALLFKTEAAGGAIEERMRIDSSGNVGIGIDHTPAQLLHVQAGSSGNGAIRVGGGAGLEISHNNSGATIQRIDSLYRTTNNSANLQLRTGTLTFHTGTSSTERMRVSSSGIVTAPYQPAFQGQAEALNNIPANSVNQTILFSEIFDQGGNFASNTFTAPVTGKYQINVHVLLENIDSAANYYQLQLITSNRIYYETVDADYGQDNSYLAVQIAVLADLDVSDTAVVRIHQNGGTAQTDVNTTTSKFSGFLAC